MSNDVVLTVATPSERGWVSPSVALNRVIESVATAPASLLDSDQDNQRLYHIARLGGFNFILPTTRIWELVADQAQFPLPNAPKAVSGMINLRGSILPVFDIYTLIGAEAPRLDSAKLLVMSGGEIGGAALIVDGIDILARPQLEGFAGRPQLPAIIAAALNRAHKVDSELWLDVQFETLFESLCHS